MTSNRDIEDIVAKLSSDKAKTREEGVKLLNSYFEGGSCKAFCALLDQNTIKCRLQDRPRSGSWPHLLLALSQCILAEVSFSKKRGPKIVLAKTLKSFVQHAEDVKRSGRKLMLLRSMKGFFNHLWDVIRDVPSFQLDYGSILRQILSVPEYALTMKKKVYSGLVLFYINKIKTSLCCGETEILSSKDELFRHAMTLHCLINYIPADIPNELRKDLIQGFIDIFGHLRDEGKIARKLVSSLNLFLLRDGPNIGPCVQDIHAAVKDFMIRTWLTTHDSFLKEGLVLYSRIQLKLRGILSDGDSSFDQLLDLVVKELDQNSLTTTGSFRNYETGRDDRLLGVLSTSQNNLMELAAAVLHETCLRFDSVSSTIKRQKRDSIVSIIKDRLCHAKCAWCCAFFILIHHHSSGLPKLVILDWFYGISTNIGRILGDGINTHIYDGPLWILRGLHELCLKWWLIISRDELAGAAKTSSQGQERWQKIWNALLHWLPLYSNVSVMMDACLKILGEMISQNLQPLYSVPQDFWNLRAFTDMPSRVVLQFVAMFFTSPRCQNLQMILCRRNLLKGILNVLEPLDLLGTDREFCLAFCHSILAVCIGWAPFPTCSICNSKVMANSDLYIDTEVLWKVEEHDKVKENELTLLDHSEYFLASSGFNDCELQETQLPISTTSMLPSSVSVPLWQETQDCLLHKLSSTLREKKDISLTCLFSICSVLSEALCGLMHMNLQRFRTPQHSSQQRMLQTLHDALVCSINVTENYVNILEEGLNCSADSVFAPFHVIEHSTVSCLRNFVTSPLFCIFKHGDNITLTGSLNNTVLPLLERLLLLLFKYFEMGTNLLRNNETYNSAIQGAEFGLDDDFQYASCQDIDSKDRIVDADLDIDNDLKPSILAGQKDGNTSSHGVKCTSGVSFSPLRWRINMVLIISSFTSIFPSVTCDTLANLAITETDPEVQMVVLVQLCRSISDISSQSVSPVVTIISDIIENNNAPQSRCYQTLCAIDIMLKQMICSGKSENIGLEEECQSCTKELLHKELQKLATLLNIVSEMGLVMWKSRKKLVDCICNFVLLDPNTAQPLTEKLLPMLSDPDFRVRLSLSKQICVLFQTWNGHEELFHDVCSNVGVKLVKVSRENIITAREVLETGIQAEPFIETALVTLGQLAETSEKIEEVAVFMICATAAINPMHRLLVRAILDRLAKCLNYATRFKYLEQLMGSILGHWVKAQLSLAALVEMREIFVPRTEPKSFVQNCSALLLPLLILSGNDSELKWLAMVVSEAVSTFVKNHFASIFAACLPLHCRNNRCDQERAEAVLQGSLLHIINISEDERDILIKKQMVSIVSSLISLCSSISEPYPPYFPKDVIISAIKTLVDGFLEIDQNADDGGVVDKINVFRPDRVFLFLLQIHYQIDSAVHHRHRSNPLARLAVLIAVIKHRVCVPSTCRYAFHIVLQSLKFSELQDHCCSLMSSLLDIFEHTQSEDTLKVLGSQLQSIVSKLVGCCLRSDLKCGSSAGSNLQVLSLLHRLTVDANPSLYDYIKELDPFPDSDCFIKIQEFHQQLCADQTPADELIKFGKRSVSLPSSLRLKSLQSLHRKLKSGKMFSPVSYMDSQSSKFQKWPCDDRLVCAVWSLVDVCHDDSAADMRDLVGDFIARVGFGDPYAVVFHLPESVSQEVFTSERKLETVNVTIGNIQGVSGDAVKAVIKLLEQYLLDDSVRVVDIAAKSLRGLLSTEKGQKVLHSMSSSEAAYIRVLAKGVNNKLVENLLSECHLKDAYDVTLLEDRSLWQIGVKTYDEWISQLVYSLIHYTDDPILRLCQEMVLLKAQLAELVFPHVLGILAGRKDENFNLVRIISNQIEQNIFAESNRNLRSIQLVLHAMNELRLCHVLARLDPIADNLKRKDNSKHIRHSATRSRNSDRILSEQSVAAKVHRTLDSVWKKVYWLQIDYLVAAKAAIRCGSYFTSILYVEHWCEENYGVLTLGDPDFSYHEQLPEHIEVLLKATKNINEPDGIHGIRSSKLVSQIFTSEHEGNWIKALQNYDLVLRTSPAQHFDGHHDSSGGLVLESGGDQATSRHEVSNWSYYKGLMKSLQQTGCSHLLDLYSEGLASRKTFLQQDFEFSELQYEAAWRAGKWDFYWVSPEMKSLEWGEERDSQQVPFNFYLHSCLRSLEDGDAQMFWMNLKNAKQELVSVLSHTSRESTQNIHSTITKLQILYHISQAWEMRWKPPGKNWANQNLQDESSSTGPFVPSNEHICWLDADWKYITNQMQLHFNLLEPFISFRRVLFQILNCNYSSLQHLIEYAKIFRKCGRLSQAATAVHEFKLLYTDMENKIGASPLCFSGRLEEAKLLRARGQSEMAINLVEYLLKHYELGDELADICRLTGKWLAEGRSRSSRTILDQYLKRAAEITEEKCSSNKSIWIERQCKTHFCLAHYTDALFQSYQERLASNEWQAALKLRRYKAKELEAVIKRLKSLTKGEKTDYAAKVVELQKQLTMDTEEAKRLQDDMDSFLIMALKSYQCCLLTGEKYNIRVVFRLVSLWLNLASNQTVVESMLETVKKVQSYKFLPLVYQIASRMGGSKDSQGQSNFQLALTFLVKKMAIDHPHHTIFQLLALANGDRVKDKQRSRSAFVVDVDKIRASEELLCELQSHHYALLCEMKQMVEIYIKLAELETKKEDTNRKILLPRDVRSVRKLELVPVITANLPVDRSCQYPEGSFPYFNGLSDHIRVMNGINAPKVVECYGSDGRKYRQLAKSGNDDLRQDAVMEQFFGLVNTLLQEHTDTLKRQLKIRTYKVVPFTPSAGVLEWVDGTIPLGEYLIGSTRNGGAHGRYRKDDWPFLTCREHMANQKDKRKAFQTVCQNFRPAMHFFFLERFSRPADWFEKRLAYTRSVATSSMVGYIVGLGDRHSMNILIDQATAEVVHIDLGVAFEQGLMLKTPERVPFRLTRDMIDGMGATGIEGVFRRCCEETLSVMRTNKEALLTIIEVFIHDPLYKWALSPLKALRRQQDFVEDEDPDEEDPEEDNEGNKDAARALLRVKQKLDGYEDGEMRSIPGQVQQLIQDAMDVERLCQMFPGWGAWL